MFIPFVTVCECHVVLKSYGTMGPGLYPGPGIYPGIYGKTILQCVLKLLAIQPFSLI